MLATGLRRPGARWRSSVPHAVLLAAPPASIEPEVSYCPDWVGWEADIGGPLSLHLTMWMVAGPSESTAHPKSATVIPCTHVKPFGMRNPDLSLCSCSHFLQLRALTLLEGAELKAKQCQGCEGEATFYNCPYIAIHGFRGWSFGCSGLMTCPDVSI